MWICISTWYVPHNYIALRHSVGRLQRSCADKTNRTVGLSFWSNFWSSKWALFREKKWIKFPVDMHIYTICSSKLQSFTTFCCVVSEELRWKEKQDCLTDWLTDVRFKNIIPSVTPCVGFNYWPLINCLGDCFNQCIHEEWKTGSSWTSSHQGRGFSAEHNADCLKVKPERTNTFTLCILWYLRNIIMFLRMIW